MFSFRSVFTIARRFSHSAANATSASAINSTFPIDRIKQVFTPTNLQTLKQQGYLVLENIFSSPQTAEQPDVTYAQQFRNEIKTLYEEQIMIPNHTHVYTGKESTLVPKHSIHEMEMSYEGISEIVPTLNELNTDQTMIKCLQENGFEIESSRMKVQLNSGNRGCFPMHFDSDLAIDGRRITAILYLNPEWKSSDGGELILYPFPRERVMITPKMDRLVLFSSAHMLHRVLPSTAADRCCVTIWFSTRFPNAQSTNRQYQNPEHVRNLQLLLASPPFNLSGTTLQLFQTLLHPSFYPHVLKLIYINEWIESIRDSHAASPDVEQMIEKHISDVEKLEEKIGAEVKQMQEILKSVRNASGHTIEPMFGRMVEWI